MFMQDFMTEKKEDTVKSYLLSYTINLMNHKTFGFGISEEEEETIVSMCTVLLLVLVVLVAGASRNTATKSI